MVARPPVWRRRVGPGEEIECIADSYQCCYNLGMLYVKTLQEIKEQRPCSLKLELAAEICEVSSET